MPSRFIPIAAGTDPTQQLAIINKNFGELDNESVKKLYYDSNGIPSIQIGVMQDGTSAIRVSKPGIDVTTASGSQLAFNSTQNALKVIATGTTSISPNFPGHGASGSGTDQVTVHVDLSSLGLTQPPALLAYIQDNTYYVPLSNGATYSSSLAPSVMVHQYFKVGVNVTDLSLSFWQSWGTGATGAIGAYTGTTFNIRYYLLQETAN